jgi:hypothetical protein
MSLDAQGNVEVADDNKFKSLKRKMDRHYGISDEALEIERKKKIAQRIVKHMSNETSKTVSDANSKF